MKSSIFYLGFFAWAPFAAALYGAYLAYGLPHVIWEYEWREINSNAQRHYLTCTHLGPYGAFKLPAKAGACAWVIFVRPQAGRPATASFAKQTIGVGAHEA